MKSETPGVGDARCGLPGGGHPSGTPRNVPRVQFQERPGVYYRPSAFRADRLSGTKRSTPTPAYSGSPPSHLYFSGSKKKFRVRYDRIVDFEPFSDGFEIMRDAQTAKPQAFKTGDGWFACNLAVNLAQM